MFRADLHDCDIELEEESRSHDVLILKLPPFSREK